MHAAAGEALGRLCAAPRRPAAAACVSATIASKSAGATWRPPKRSASVTTPMGSEVQATMQCCASSRPAKRRSRWRLRRVEVEQDQLRGAAADVEHEDVVAARVDKRRRAGYGEPRLHLARQDLDLEAELVAHAREEFPAVLGDAAGFRGDEARAAHLGAAELGGADFERIERARHGRLREAPRLANALAKADDAREGIDDAEAAARRAGEQQAAVVGAEVERAVDAVGTRVASLARGRRGAVGAAVVLSDRRKMGVDGGGKVAAAGSGLRRSGGAALVGIALHSSSSSAWHLAVLRNVRVRPRHQASSG